MVIGPAIFDIRYITNEYMEICGLRNLVRTEEHCVQLLTKKLKIRSGNL